MNKKLQIPYWIWKAMKVSVHQLFLLALFGSFSYAVSSNGQSVLDKNISMNVADARFKGVLAHIEAQANVRFIYSSSTIDTRQRVNLKVENRKLEVVLRELLQPLSIDYSVNGNRILLKNSVPEPQSGSNTTSFRGNGGEVLPDRSVSGRVTDEKGEGLPGVSVLLKGTQQGTITDVDGHFTINIVDEEAVMVFSFVGHIGSEIAVRGKSEFNVVLQTDQKALDEIVVTGYSSERRKDIIGSVAVVDMNASKTIPGGSAVRALQGQASGVNVISSGVPGGGSTINIRGVNSFGNNQPLIMVDGVEANLNEISANDIESIQVLKDAGAAAIYGVRGANGVVIVTTKKGKSGAPKVSYDAYFGTQRPLRGNVFDLLNSEDYARLTKIAFPGSQLFKDGLPDYLYSGPGVQGTGMEGDPQVDPSRYVFDVANPANNYLIQKVNKTGTDWFHEIFKPAPIQEHNLSVSGGTEKSRYLVSLGYLNQQGTLIETYHKRLSARINTDFNIGKNIRFGENLYIYLTQNPGFSNQAEANAISHTYRQMPIIPVYDISGNFGGMFAGPDLGNAMNPVAVQKRTINNRGNNWSTVGNFFVEADFLRDFTLRTSMGGSFSNYYNIGFNFNRYNDREGSTALNGLSESSGYSTNTIWTNTLSYSRQTGKHLLKALVGSEAIVNYSRNLSASRNDYFSTEFEYLILNNGTTNLNNASSASRNTLYSLFGRVDYSFADKYLVGVTVRRDGSSRFGEGRRFGVFPSFSAGWRLSEEPFMKELNWISDLKLKGSYGVLGSQNNVDPANSFTLFGSGIGTSYYDISGTNTSAVLGFYQTRNGNPSTGWEKNIISNIGFDASLLNNRVSLSAEYYKKSIDGLLFPLPLPATAGGAAVPTVNIGDVQNKGLDLALGYQDKIGQDFRYSIGMNITTYQNEIVHTPDPGYFDTGDSRNGNLIRNQVGHPVSSFFGYKVMGVFRDENEVESAPEQTDAAPGRFRYEDVNGDGVINTSDRTFTGNPNPDFTYGLNLGANYKGFDFMAVFYGSQGNEVYNLVKYYTHFYSGFRGGRSNALLNAWTPENPVTDVPRIEAAGNFSTSSVPNSYYIENGSFFKLRSVVLGYTLPGHWVQKVRAGNVRFYLQAANLFTITGYSGLDPELMGSSSAFGIDRGNYPNNQQSFLLGLNVSF